MSIFTDNKGFSPVPAFNFLLRVEMAFDVPVKSVRAFSKNFEYEYIQEGGLNDYVHMRRKPISQPFTLEIERYAATDLYYDPLQNGTELMLPLLLFVSPQAAEFMGYSRRTFAFTGCTVTGKEYGGLDAEKGGLLTEVIKIAYRQIVVLDLPETILKEKDGYSKLFGGGTITEESMKKEKYGRQVDDAEFQSMLTASEAIDNYRSYITEDGKLEGEQSADKTFSYLTGEVGSKIDANKREYKKDYGDFSGDKSGDINSYLEGETNTNPDANKRSWPEDESYYGKEITKLYEDSAVESQRIWPKDESYYGKEIADQYKSSAKEKAREWPKAESAFGISYYKKGK